MMRSDLMRQQLIAALRKARMKPVRKDEIEPGKLTNENGPAVTTNKTPNAHPEDGDYS
jgi:hypothetical protein